MLLLISLGVFGLSALSFLMLIFNGPIPVSRKGWRKWRVYQNLKTISSAIGVVAGIMFFIGLVLY